MNRRKYKYSLEHIGVHDTTKGFHLNDNPFERLICCDEVQFNMEVACDILNELNEENIQLRELLDVGKTNAKSILDVLNDQEERLNRLHEENQKLKSEIEDIIGMPYERIGDYDRKRKYSLCTDCKHQKGLVWDTWCPIKKRIDCDEVFECDMFEEIK